MVGGCVLNLCSFLKVGWLQKTVNSQKEKDGSPVFHFSLPGIARTQSPSPRNYAPESPTFEAIAGVSPPECNGQASPWEYPLVDQGVSCAR